MTSIKGQPAAPVVEELASALTDILKTAHEVALETCETKLTNPSRTHYRKRKDSKQRSKMSKALKSIRLLHKETHQTGITNRDAVADLITTSPEITPEIRQWWDEAVTTDANSGLSGQQLLLHIMKQTRAEIQKMDGEHNKEAYTTAIAKTRHLIDSKPKMANRQIFRSAQPSSTYPALKNPETGLITDDPKDMSKIAEKHFSEVLKAPTGSKHGKYHPMKHPGLAPGLMGQTNSDSRQMPPNSPSGHGSMRW